MIVNPEARVKAARLTAIANELLAMADRIERRAPQPGASDLCGLAQSIIDEPADGDDDICTELAREGYRNRRRRDKIFAADGLFGEPAWDILLDLFIAAKEERRVSVASACIGAAVPASTAMRWITALERESLVMRDGDVADGRRGFVELSPRAHIAMAEYFRVAA